MTLDHQRDEERRKDARQLRDSRRERLRKSIEPVFAVALILGQAVMDKQAIYRTESEEQQDARDMDALKEHWGDLNKARADLMVETVGRGLLKISDEQILGSYRRYMTRLTMNVDHPGSVPREELDREQAALRGAIEQFRSEAERLLEQLDRPI